MWQLLGVLFAGVSSLIIFSATHLIKDKMTREVSQDYFAKEVAKRWETFGSSLKKYVEDNVSSLPTGDTIITCTDLKNSGYLQSSFPCTDMFGQELRGLASKPVGALQTILVYPATPPSTDLYLKMGIKERLGQRAFIFRIASSVKKLNPDYEFVAYKKDGTFEETFSRTSDRIDEYIDGNALPASFPSDNAYEYAPVLFVKRAKGVGYWVWNVYETDYGMTFSNAGFSSACPSQNGLPLSPPNSQWSFNPLGWGYPHRNYSVNPEGATLSGVICIPASQDTVLKNPGASIPALAVPIDQSFLDTYIENKPDAEGDYISYTWANCGGRSYFGVTEISIGARKYTVFGWQNVCSRVCRVGGSFPCPSGGTYNSSKRRCELSPSCPSGGIYNTTINKCEVAISALAFTGQTGSNYYGGGTCYTTVAGNQNRLVFTGCTPGIISANASSITFSGSVTVALGGTNYYVGIGVDSITNEIVFKRCVASVGFGVGSISCNTEYGRIKVYGATISLQSYNSVDKLLWYCFASSGCVPLTGQSNAIKDTGGRYLVFSSTCPSGYTYDPTTGKCVATPTCPSGYTFSSADDLCVQPVSCPNEYANYIGTHLMLIEGSAPSTFCIDLLADYNYNYCFNLDSLLSAAGGSRSSVSFLE